MKIEITKAARKRARKSVVFVSHIRNPPTGLRTKTRVVVFVSKTHNCRAWERDAIVKSVMKSPEGGKNIVFAI